MVPGLIVLPATAPILDSEQVPVGGVTGGCPPDEVDPLVVPVEPLVVPVEPLAPLVDPPLELVVVPLVDPPLELVVVPLVDPPLELLLALGSPPGTVLPLPSPASLQPMSDEASTALKTTDARRNVDFIHTSLAATMPTRRASFSNSIRAFC
jgi:hypothetical protein